MGCHTPTTRDDPLMGAAAGAAQQASGRGLTRRSALIATGATGALLLARRASAQNRVRTVAVIMAGPEDASDTQLLLLSFRQGLAEAGWANPDAVRLEVRFNVTDAVRAAAEARSVLALGPDVVLANTNIVAEEVLKVTRTTPVVFMPVGDPIGAGFIESYSRPGYNATGFTDFEPSHGGKWLSLLREMVPTLRRVALVFNPGSSPANGWLYLTSFTTDAMALGIDPLAVRITRVEDFESMVRAQSPIAGTGFVVASDAFMMVNRTPMLQAAAIHRCPTIYPFTAYAEEGGLMSYSIDMPGIFRRGGAYVGRILDGQSPAVLPVQAPDRFQLTINMATATTLGLVVPERLLAIADRVIE